MAQYLELGDVRTWYDEHGEELMAADTIAFFETVVAGAAHLVGWSAGGMALHAALWQ